MIVNDIEREGHLYIIIDEHSGSRWFKVGRTSNPTQRLKQYNEHLPVDRVAYSYLSPLLYDCHAAEAVLLDKMRTSGRYKEAKKEWFKNLGQRNLRARIATVVNMIEDITNQYAEEVPS